MKLLILCPGKIPQTTEGIKCFTDILNYYIPLSLKQVAETDVIKIPSTDGPELKKIFSEIPVAGYDAIITLGLRFYNKIPIDTTQLIRSRFNGLFCQTYDGTRLDNDPVDITFTFKNDDERMKVNSWWYSRHKKYNECIGWAADSSLNTPMQDPSCLRILIDHTNYGDNPTDNTVDIILQVKELVDSGIWKTKYNSIMVRRFDSGKIIDVDFEDLSIRPYDRTAIPFTEITKEHGKAHIFMVTHPESVGLVVLETSMAGALTVVPDGYIQNDRLQTVRHYKYSDRIEWDKVLQLVDPTKSRKVAESNSWNKVASTIIEILTRRKND